MVGLCSKIYVCFNSFVIVLNRKILCFGSYHNPKYVFVNKSWTLFFLPLIEIVKAFSNQPSTILFVNTFHCKTQKQISSLKKKNPKRVIVSCKNKPNKVSKITCYTISQQNLSERQMLIKSFFSFLFSGLHPVRLVVKMATTIKTLVSKKKQRYVEDGYNLDLSYINERVRNWNAFLLFILFWCFICIYCICQWQQ